MKLLDYLLKHYPDLDERSARGLIMRGDVLVSDKPQTSPELTITQEPVRIRGLTKREVSRGRRKLEPVLASAGVNCRGRICLDLGAADGGFTSVLLENGAARVYAVDIAYGVLSHELRTSEKVVVLERTNARTLTAAQIPEQVEIVTGDLSFIGWGAVLPAVRPLADKSARFLLLVKPQFELAATGNHDLLVQGIVRDTNVMRNCLISLYETWQNNDMVVLDMFPSPIKGRKGNLEFFASLSLCGAGLDETQYNQRVDEIVTESFK